MASAACKSVMVGTLSRTVRKGDATGGGIDLGLRGDKMAAVVVADVGAVVAGGAANCPGGVAKFPDGDGLVVTGTSGPLVITPSADPSGPPPSVGMTVAAPSEISASAVPPGTASRCRRALDRAPAVAKGVSGCIGGSRVATAAVAAAVRRRSGVAV